jgi:hypothetical protein
LFICRFVRLSLCFTPFCASAIMFYAVLRICRFECLPFRDMPFCMCIVYDGHNDYDVYTVLVQHACPIDIKSRHLFFSAGR